MSPLPPKADISRRSQRHNSVACGSRGENMIESGWEVSLEECPCRSAPQPTVLSLTDIALRYPAVRNATICWLRRRQPPLMEQVVSGMSGPVMSAATPSKHLSSWTCDTPHEIGETVSQRPLTA